jgi:hypothetical protein
VTEIQCATLDEDIYHNQFLSRRRVVSFNTDDDCTRVGTAITQMTGENVVSMISSVCD